MAFALVVDDDESYGPFMESLLRRFGYRTFCAVRGESALGRVRELRPDLIILDSCLPGAFTGERTLRILKTQESTKDIPVVVVSGERHTAAHERAARDAGAELFMSKGEVGSLIKSGFLERHLAALVIRRRAAGAASHPILRFGDDLIIDETRRSVVVLGRSADGVTSRLFVLLCEFARFAGQTLTRDHLVARVWDGEDVHDRAVDRSVARLRECLGEPVGRWIVTCPGHGYRFVPAIRPVGKFAPAD